MPAKSKPSAPSAQAPMADHLKNTLKRDQLHDFSISNAQGTPEHVRHAPRKKV